jgi:hypothetical protein
MAKRYIVLVVLALLACPYLGAEEAVEQAPAQKHTPTPLELGAKTGVERILSFVLEAPAKVEGVRWDPKEGILKLEKLRIANPKGFKSDKPAMTIAEAYVKAQPDLLLAKEPTIQLVRLKGAVINTEQSLAGGFNIKKLTDSAARFKKPDMKLLQLLGKRFRIDKGVLADTELNLSSDLMKPKTWKLDTIEMDYKQLSGGKSMRADEILAKSLQRVMEEVLSRTTGGTGLSGLTGLLGK